MKLNLAKELSILEKNYYLQLEQHNVNYRIFYKKDNTFRTGNWVITFPYNFYKIKNKKISIEIIRKLAVINSIWGQYYFREDCVLDEYHSPVKIYRSYLVEMCQARILRNLAVGQLLYLCGNDIYNYVFEYEKKFYNALIFEKNNNDITLNNMLDYDNLIFLGHKIMPLCITFTAFCLLEGNKEKIPVGEKLVINYHIAHQLYDDCMDFSQDIKKPDMSYILKSLKNHLNNNELTINDIKNMFNKTNIRKKIVNVMGHYLSVSRKYAQQLRFDLLLLKIKDLERKVQKFDRISNDLTKG